MAKHPDTSLPATVPVGLEKVALTRTERRQYLSATEDLASICPLDNGRHAPQAGCSLGNLDQLPLEVQWRILINMDLRTLTDLRRVNRRAMEVVDSVPQYQELIEHCSNVIRSILSVEMGHFITFNQLCRTLSVAECESCGNFGGHIYLLTCSRVCYLCSMTRQKYLPLTKDDAVTEFGLEIEAIEARSIPQMRNIPHSGFYNIGDFPRDKRKRLLDPGVAEREGTQLRGSREAMMDFVTQKAAERGSKKSLAPWRLFGDGNPPFRTAYDPKRFMALTPAPWIDPVTGEVDWGFHCKGCMSDAVLEYAFEERQNGTLYTVPEFEKHAQLPGGVHAAARAAIAARAQG